jgi:hypothetical protein
MRRIVSTVLILALAVFVSPIPVVAYAPARSSFVQACAPGSPTGCLTGVAQDAAKNPLPQHTVRVRNVKTGEITNTTFSAADGNFSFSGITPGDYVVEIVNPVDGTVVAMSAPVSVAAGTTAAITVTASAAAGLVSAGGFSLLGMGTAASIGAITAASIAGLAIAVVATKDDGSPSR